MLPSGMKRTRMAAEHSSACSTCSGTMAALLHVAVLSTALAFGVLSLVPLLAPAVRAAANENAEKQKARDEQQPGNAP